MVSQIIEKMHEGGLFFTLPIFILLILIIVLFVLGMIDQKRTKTISLLSSIGLFTLVWGLLGQTLGLVQAFDAVGEAGDISFSIVAEGLKVSLISTISGVISFLASRLGIIILIWIRKEENEETK